MSQRIAVSEEVMAELAARYASKPRPTTFKDLVSENPDLNSELNTLSRTSSRVFGRTFTMELRARGLLALDNSVSKMVRLVSAKKMFPLFVGAIGNVYIEPGDDATTRLPPTVVGLDVQGNAELREELICIDGTSAQNARMGDVLAVKVVADAEVSEGDLSIQIGSKPAASYQPGKHVVLPDGRPSQLAQFTGATVVSKYEHAGTCIAQVELRYLAAIRSGTMLYVLRDRGIVTDADLAGGDSWRLSISEAAFSRSSATLCVAAGLQSTSGTVAQVEAQVKAEQDDAPDAAPEAAEHSTTATQADLKPQAAAPTDEACRAEEVRAADEAQRAAEEAARRQAEEDARRRAEEQLRAEEEAREAEEAARRQAEEDARRRAEEEARARAEAERQQQIKAQEEAVAELEGRLRAAQDELAAFDRRAREIGVLEAKAVDIKSYVSGLGLFKFKEKKAKQQELAQVMARIADLTQQNVGRAQQQTAVDAAQHAVDEARNRLEEMRG